MQFLIYSIAMNISMHIFMPVIQTFFSYINNLMIISFMMFIVKLKLKIKIIYSFPEEDLAEVFKHTCPVVYHTFN